MSQFSEIKNIKLLINNMLKFYNAEKEGLPAVFPTNSTSDNKTPNCSGNFWAFAFYPLMKTYGFQVS